MNVIFQPVVRIYDIPDNTFETDEEDDSDETDTDDEDDDGNVFTFNFNPYHISGIKLKVKVFNNWLKIGSEYFSHSLKVLVNWLLVNHLEKNSKKRIGHIFFGYNIKSLRQSIILFWLPCKQGGSRSASF